MIPSTSCQTYVSSRSDGRKPLGGCGAAPWLGRWLILAGLALGSQDLIAWDGARMLSAASAFGPRTVAVAAQLQQVIAHASTQDVASRLSAVNDFFNRHIEFRTDQEVWGEDDFWASPLQALAKGRGDCEDYAIAKFASLVAAGTPAARLRLVYVRVRRVGGIQAHMVLAYYASAHAEPVILDNLVSRVETASKRPDLTPVFSFNGEGLWQGVGERTAGNPLERLSRWRDVLGKMRAQGFL